MEMEGIMVDRWIWVNREIGGNAGRLFIVVDMQSDYVAVGKSIS